MFEAIKNFFMRGKANMQNNLGIGTLTAITDHPRINVDPLEVERVNRDLNLYEAIPTDRKFTNMLGKTITKKNNTFNFLQSACDRFASVLFNQNCRISVGDGTTTASNDAPSEKAKTQTDFINGILANNHFNGNMQRYLAAMLATGGMAVLPYWDASAQQMKLTWVMATNFYPLRSNTGEVSECAIASTTTTGTRDNRQYYTLLEFHSWNNGIYNIDFELYLSPTNTMIGSRVPLSDQYPDLQEHVEYDGFSSPLFAYIKPAKFNNINPNSPLGIGFADNSRSTLKFLDRQFTELGRAIEVSKQRIAISGDMASWIPNADGTPAPSQPTFDLDDEVFTAIDGGADGETIKDLTLKSPIDAQKATIDYLIHNFELQNNVSSGTFSMNENATAITATQVVSENSTTYQTRASYLTNVEQGVKEIVIAIFELASKTVDANGFPVWSGDIPDFSQVSVDFDDGVFQDRQSLITEVMQLKNANLMSQVSALMKIYNCTRDQAETMAQEIKSEQPITTFSDLTQKQDQTDPDAQEE